MRDGVEPVLGITPPKTSTGVTAHGNDLDIDSPFGEPHLGAAAGHVDANDLYDDTTIRLINEMAFEDSGHLTPNSFLDDSTRLPDPPAEVRIPIDNNSNLIQNPNISGRTAINDFTDRTREGLINASPTATTTPIRTIWDDDSYGDLLQRVAYSLGVFDDADFATVRPQVNSILEEGYRAGKTPTDIETELSAIWSQYNKPMFKHVQIETGPRTRASLPYSFASPRRVIVDGNREFVNSVYSATPLDRTTVPSHIGMDDELGYSHWTVMDSNSSEIGKLKSEVLANTPHGGATYEMSKSLQSSPLAHQGYIRMARNGKGMISYVSDGNGGYEYMTTNGLEGSTWSPRFSGGRVNRPSGMDHLTKNVR